MAYENDSPTPTHHSADRYLIQELRRLSDKCEALGAEINNLRVEKADWDSYSKLDIRVRKAEESVASQKVVSSIWGGVSGLIPNLIMLIVKSAK